jgi:hypothetical protein
MATATIETRPTTPRELLVWVAIALATAALCTAVYLTTQYSTAQDLFVYRVTLLLLFFAISTVSALIFNAKASLGGSVWGLTLALGGPAVLWIVALVIFTRFYPEAELKKETTLQSLAQQVWSAQERNGWKDYDTWKTERGDAFGDVLGVNETQTLKNLFWNVYYRSPGQRLENVQITTVFLYFGPKYTMKFQRIRGNRESTSAEPFTLHYGAQTSNNTGNSGSVLLVGRNNGSLHLKENYFDGESRPEQALEQTDIDCLIVSWYDDEVTRDGDYITADMKEFATNHRGDLRLGVATFKPMQDVQSWWLGGRTVTDKDDVLPLAFRKMRQAWQTDLGAVEDELQPWLQLLDKAMASEDLIKGKPMERLQSAMKSAGEVAGHPIKASELLASAVFKDRRSASMPEAEDVVLTMFLWQ